MLAKSIICINCKKEFSPSLVVYECEECGGPVDIMYDYEKIKKHLITSLFYQQKPTHWKYHLFYPIEDLDKRVTLDEGGTPLLPSVRQKGYFFKIEGQNPTGSFKDRGSTVEISKAVELGVAEVACATTGNMGSSVATYCARAGLKCSIYLPSFAPKNKVLQIRMMTDSVHIVKGTYEDALRKTKELRKKKHVYLTGDYAYRGEGEKSVGFEILDQLNWNVPDYIVLPVGNATLFSATYKACMEMKQVGLISKLPRLVAVQSAGCKPLVDAFEKGMHHIPLVKQPQTLASAIACGNPVDGLKALIALKKTRGLAVAVKDSEILNAREELARHEGIFVEPSGAVSYAGAKKLHLDGKVVCVLTGHGLKDAEKY
ncbi:threonine synthase [Candidatus Woesearchaeota archaeon]|nr:threonine synthase [Candidatus Woesearchaeota archaeon]